RLDVGEQGPEAALVGLGVAHVSLPNRAVRQCQRSADDTFEGSGQLENRGAPAEGEVYGPRRREGAVEAADEDAHDAADEGEVPSLTAVAVDGERLTGQGGGDEGRDH